MRVHIYKRGIIASTLLIIAVGLFFVFQYFNTHTSTPMNMKISSPAFEHNTSIPQKYTCDGEGVNPLLEISGVPEEAKSLVLIMEDPDVPKSIREDGMWDHWIKFDMSPSITQIEEGAEMEGISGKGTAGNLDYQGPCPPDREHRYFFKLYALDGVLGLPQGVSKKDVEKAMEGYIIEKAELIGLYDRSQK